MSGPGWMPSRPRPLARIKRALWTPGYVHTRRQRPAGTVTPREPLESRFDGAAKLPTATLLPARSEVRSRLLGDLRHWLAPRWGWVRPRAVPILAAVIGMFAVIGVEKYLSALARGDYAPPRACHFETASVEIVDLTTPVEECGGAPLRRWTLQFCNTTHTVVACP
jgi:hypothetical protein